MCIDWPVSGADCWAYPVTGRICALDHVRHRRTTAVAAPPPLNRPAFAKLQCTHTACGSVRRAFVRHWKKLGANRRRKATEGNPRQRVATTDVGERTIPTETPGSGCHQQTPTPKPGGGAASTDQGKPHDQAVVADRQELQVVSVGFGHSGNHGSAAPALTVGGRCHKPSAYLLFLNTKFKRKPALPNHSFNRTHCGAPPFAPPFHSGSNASTPQRSG